MASSRRRWCGRLFGQKQRSLAGAVMDHARAHHENDLFERGGVPQINLKSCDHRCAVTGERHTPSVPFTKECFAAAHPSRERTTGNGRYVELCLAANFGRSSNSEK